MFRPIRNAKKTCIRGGLYLKNIIGDISTFCRNQLCNFLLYVERVENNVDISYR